ncbi:hypothetical protein OHA07_08750 [Micrococcus luteus]|uniref:hypothetical protein n=1 Tax=Micrococcus luteus TaxID=1270 RepID=UPI0032558FAD
MAGVLVGRTLTRLADAGNAAARQGRTSTGGLTVPAWAWAASPAGDAARGGVPLARRVLPLPASARLTRAVTGARRPSLDAWNPLGPRTPRSPGVLLLPVDPAEPGAWRPEDAAALAASRARSLKGAGLHTVVTDARRRGPRMARLLHRSLGRQVPGVLVVPRAVAAADAPGRWTAMLSLVDAVVVPHPERASPALRDLAAAAGRAVLSPADAAAPPAALAARGRAARLELARRGTPLTPPPAPPPPRVRVGAQPRRVVVAGHDLKFAGGLIAELRARGHEVRVDEWRGHARHDPGASAALARWADVVHCEWSLGNASWYSRHRPDGTRLTVRTHLQEASTQFPRRVRQDAVDSWVFVAEHVRAQVLRDIGFPAERAHWIPNAVRIPGLVPPSAGDPDPLRRFTLGLVGVLPARKGLHRALDLLAALRAEDPRFRLVIRGHRPEDVAWMTARPDEAAYFAEQTRRMAEDPLLKSAVTWDPHGPDMGAWYARVGVALSVSDFESFHFTLPDGAVHGCLPRSLAWAGADLLYPPDWLSASTDEMARRLHAEVSDPARSSRLTAEAAAYVEERFGERRVVPALADAVLGLR